MIITLIIAIIMVSMITKKTEYDIIDMKCHMKCQLITEWTLKKVKTGEISRNSGSLNR